jgi:DNA-binding PadR family transcriptional regulator
MSTRLVILGLLRDRPLYGYEIKQIITEHMDDWTNIAFGSIYFALGKLADEGFVEKVATQQEGNRPSRSIYQITEAGEAEFLRLLREIWANLERNYFEFDIGLFFMPALPIDEIKGHLQARVAQLESVVQHLKQHQVEQMSNPEVPALARAIFEHSHVHFEAELAWSQDLLTKVVRGEYP